MEERELAIFEYLDSSSGQQAYLVDMVRDLLQNRSDIFPSQQSIREALKSNSEAFGLTDNGILYLKFKQVGKY